MATTPGWTPATDTMTLRAPTRTGHVSVPPDQIPRLPLWLCVVQVILAYEWLVSGINKLLDAGFSGQLMALLSQSTHSNPTGVYSTVMTRLVLPNHTLVAWVTPWTETSVGAVLALGAILWVARPRARSTVLVAGASCLALLTAATLDLNYNLINGGGLPWINPANATTNGISIDVMLLSIALALCAANAQVCGRWRHARQGEPHETVAERVRTAS